MVRILITGGSSYLGQHLVPLAAADHKSAYTFHTEDPRLPGNGYRLDVREQESVIALLASARPQVIIHTVGSNRGGDMSNVIIEGTRNVCRAATQVGARLIHISTDVVFNGRNGPYNELAIPDPLHEYGRAKAEAERLVADVEDHVIVRTSLIYGLQQMDRGTAWMVEALRAGEPVTLFSDQLRNPVWAVTLSQACLELAGGTFRGILNVAGRQVLSRAEFGLRMLEWWGVQERATLRIGTSDPARWPADCTLDLRLAEQLLSTPLWGVDEVLSGRSTEERF